MSVKRTRQLQCVLGQRGLLSPSTIIFFPCCPSHFGPAACLLVTAPRSENPAAFSVEMQPRLALIMS